MCLRKRNALSQNLVSERLKYKFLLKREQKAFPKYKVHLL